MADDMSNKLHYHHLTIRNYSVQSVSDARGSKSSQPLLPSPFPLVYQRNVGEAVARSGVGFAPEGS